MNFKLTVLTDEKYYKEAYEEIISSKRYKKWEPVFSILLTLSGVGLYLFDTNRRIGIFPFFIIGAGVYEFLKFYLEKKKWLKDRLDSKIVGQPIEMEFSDNFINHSGPFSNGSISWSGIQEIIKTRRGILLKPETGISVYLPDRIFENNTQIEFILSRKNKNRP